MLSTVFEETRKKDFAAVSNDIQYMRSERSQAFDLFEEIFLIHTKYAGDCHMFDES